MSTAVTPCINRGPIMSNPSERTSKVDEVIRKVRTLRNLTKTTGFYTTKSVGMLLANLSPDELVEVADALDLTPAEMPRR